MKRLLTTAAAAALLSHTPALAEKVVVTADRMLDVKTGKMVDYPAIFIGDDGRITSVADARTVRWSSEVRHIALPGKTLLPGLIDMHVHLTSRPTSAVTTVSNLPTPSSADGGRQCQDHARSRLHHRAQRRLALRNDIGLRRHRRRLSPGPGSWRRAMPSAPPAATATTFFPPSSPQEGASDGPQAAPMSGGSANMAPR